MNKVQPPAAAAAPPSTVADRTPAENPASTNTATCTVRPWCVVAHKVDPAQAEHHGEPLTITLPGDLELLSIALADLADPHGPEAWVAGTDTADLSAEQLDALIDQLAAALPKLRAMHAVLVASRVGAAGQKPGVPA